MLNLALFTLALFIVSLSFVYLSFVESVLPVHEEDAEKVKASMLQFISLIVAGRQPAQQKRDHCVRTPAANPLKLQKCRRLAMKTLISCDTSDEVNHTELNSVCFSGDSTELNSLCQDDFVSWAS